MAAQGTGVQKMMINLLPATAPPAFALNRYILIIALPTWNEISDHAFNNILKHAHKHNFLRTQS